MTAVSIINAYFINRLNSLRYSVDRDNINMTKKINIMSYPAFSRAVQNFLETYEDANFRDATVNPISTPNVVQSMVSERITLVLESKSIYNLGFL